MEILFKLNQFYIFAQYILYVFQVLCFDKCSVYIWLNLDSAVLTIPYSFDIVSIEYLYLCLVLRFSSGNNIVLHMKLLT